MKTKIFNAVCKTRYLALLVVLIFTCGNAWGTDFDTNYNHAGQGTSWSITNASNESSYYKSSISSDCVVTVSGIFTGKTITSDVVVTLDVACYGNGTNPTSSKFSIFNSSACTSQVTASQSGELPSSSTYKSTVYTISQANAAAGFTNDLAIKIASGTKLIRFRSFRVQFSYTSGATTYNVYLMSGCTGGSYSSNKGTSGSGTGAYSSCTKYSGISAGTSVTITAAPTSGYQFDGWTDEGSSIIFDDSYNEITPSSTTSTTATFTMPSSDVVIWQCNFSESCTNSVTINKGTETNCTISASAASVSTCSGTRQVTISVTPNSCYAGPTDATIITKSGTAATLVSGPTLNSGRYDYVYSFAENATGSTTFNASLSTKTTYTVSYETGATTCTGSNAISGSHANDTKTCGSGLTLPGATFTTTGYTQTGWSKTSCGSQYAAVGGSYTDNAAQTFYPVWTPNNYTVTWMVNGEAYTTGTPSDNANYGTKVTTLPTAPTPPCGDVFVGWSTTNIGSTGLDKDDDAAAITALNLFTTQAGSPIITGNTVFYAVFADYAD